MKKVKLLLSSIFVTSCLLLAVSCSSPSGNGNEPENPSNTDDLKVIHDRTQKITLTPGTYEFKLVNRSSPGVTTFSDPREATDYYSEFVYEFVVPEVDNGDDYLSKTVSKTFFFHGKDPDQYWAFTEGGSRKDKEYEGGTFKCDPVKMTIYGHLPKWEDATKQKIEYELINERVLNYLNSLRKVNSDYTQFYIGTQMNIYELKKLDK